MLIFLFLQHIYFVSQRW